MRRLSILCLATLSAISMQRPAEAGHRGRRAAKTAAVATTGAAAVAAAPRRETVVAAAPAVVYANYTATPDLTVAAIAADGDILAITVQNIGQAPSPQTRLRVELHRPVDGAVVAVETTRVLPLE